MKKTTNILLVIAVAIPLVLLFLPFCHWNGVMALILRIVPALAAQVLLFRIGKHNIIKTLPALLASLFAAWGTCLYFTSPHWSNATMGDLIADYVSPFICCIVTLIVCPLIQKEKQRDNQSSYPPNRKTELDGDTE